jgi:PTH2 family peptidyl-tRNA hydrolase
MPPGKLASQACHASKNCAILAAEHDPANLRLYQGPDFLGTQIILRAKNENSLLLAHEKAKSSGLITSLIIDQNHIMPPHFDGSPIITALGIGPCTKEQANHITKRFELVR